MILQIIRGIEIYKKYHYYGKLFTNKMGFVGEVVRQVGLLTGGTLFKTFENQ